MKDCVVQYYSRSDMEVEERVNGRVNEVWVELTI